jgi:ATP-dependent Clp protease ATP-binding subunit ClpB
VLRRSNPPSSRELLAADQGNGRPRTGLYRCTQWPRSFNARFRDSVSAAGEAAETVREQVMEEVRRAFRPEFLNRLDEILLFNRLSRANMSNIVEIQLNRLRKLLADRKIELKFDSTALQWLANRGYDPVYGARPLKRVIQRSLQNSLATQLLKGKVRDGETVEIGVRNGELTVGGEQVMSEAAD